MAFFHLLEDEATRVTERAAGATVEVDSDALSGRKAGVDADYWRSLTPMNRS